MRLACQVIVLVFLAIAAGYPAMAGDIYSIDEAVAAADARNPEIAIARKQLEAARGGLIQARAGYLPSVLSTGLAREREHQTDSQLRNEDYSGDIRIAQKVYTGGAVQAQVAIGRLNVEKQELELKAISNRVAMDVRVAFNELLLNRAKVRVHQQTLGVLEEELKTQEQRLSAGLVGQLNVHRAEVAVANEKTEVIDAETQVSNSYLRLGELLGRDADTKTKKPTLDVRGQLQYHLVRPELNECLVRADMTRPEILSAEKDVEIENRQESLDRSELRPQVDAFSGYEFYNERDPAIGQEFNHGYVLGVNARWHIFDGWATKGKVLATRARREAALQALAAKRLSVASDVRSALLDLQQADRVLESETKSVQTADESLEIAKANVSAGLGTQLDILQAASDVTRTRTIRLNGIYLHNVALAKLARACASSPEVLGFTANRKDKTAGENGPAAAEIAQPPKKLTQR